MKPILLIGIGNQGRGDDGLGWAFADRLEGDDRFDLAYRYQLQVEDAELISRYGQVWFVDASHRPERGGFSCEQIQGEGEFSYTSHSLHPQVVVQLCRQVFQRHPKALLLGISGVEFGLGKSLSPAAREHLDSALAFFLREQERDIIAPPGIH